MIRALKTTRDPPPLGRLRRRGVGRWGRCALAIGWAIRRGRQRGPPATAPPASVSRGRNRESPRPVGASSKPGHGRASVSVTEAHRDAPAVRGTATHSSAHMGRRDLRPPMLGVGRTPELSAATRASLSSAGGATRPPTRRRCDPHGTLARRTNASLPFALPATRRLAPTTVAWTAADDLARPPRRARRGRLKPADQCGPRWPILRSSFPAAGARACTVVISAFTLASGARQFLP